MIALIFVSADTPRMPEDAQDMVVAITEPSPPSTPSPPSRAERLAPLASLVLPGTGELIRGYGLKGELFLWGDGLAIAGAAGFGWDAANKRNSSISMTVIYADANPLNRSRTYLGAMENYFSSDDYNVSVAREARSLYPDDLAAQQEYIASNSFRGDDFWMWGSDSLWTEFLNQRIRMRKAQQTSTAFLGLMLLTRVASVMDVAFFSPVGSSRLGIVPRFDIPGIQLTWRF